MPDYKKAIANATEMRLVNAAFAKVWQHAAGMGKGSAFWAALTHAIERHGM